MTLLQMSLQGGLIAAAAVLLRAAARDRLPKTSFLFLWGLVIVRMLVPFTVFSKWSAFQLLRPALHSAAMPAQTQIQPVPGPFPVSEAAGGGA